MRGRASILAAIAKLRVFHSGERRAPHKPLLLLLALARLQREGRRTMPFAEVERDLGPLLDAYAPPVATRHQPELPYWHLQSDGLWSVKGAAELPLQRGGFPRMAALRKTTGEIPREVAATLVAQPNLEQEVVHRLLQDHFPESLHDEILAAVGLDARDLGGVPDRSVAADGAGPRDPAFRAAVLRAYGYQCALSGFHLQLRGAHIGIEAAHVHWHSHGGPDRVANGLALQSTMHKLFDAGAWSLTDDHRVLVSQDVTGADETTAQLRKLHGTKIRPPLLGSPPVSVDFIRWHREPTRGGVFRQPAFSL